MAQRKVSKASIKKILDRYAEGNAQLTMGEFKVLLDKLCKKKKVWDAEKRRHVEEESDHMYQKLLPLYADMQRTGNAPKRELVIMVMKEVNKPFTGFRRKSTKENKPKEKFPSKQDVVADLVKASTKVIASATMTKAKPKIRSQEEVREKLMAEWRQENSGYGCRLDHIKSIGNGL